MTQITQVPTISATHVDHMAHGWLGLANHPDIARYEGGWFIYFGEADSASEALFQYQSLASLQPVAAWFHQQHPECAWLRIDIDGEIVADLQQYDL